MESTTGEKFTLTEKYDAVGTGTKTPLDGAWQQTARYNIMGNDTTRADLTEFKFYNSGHVMWGATWKDSAQKVHTGIGFGTFTLSDENIVKESMKASTFYQVRGKDHTVKIEMMGNDKFRQIITNADQTSIEEYERLKK